MLSSSGRLWNLRRARHLAREDSPTQMKHIQLSLLILALPITLCAIVAQTPSVVAQDRVTVQPRRVVLLRSRKVARDFPGRQRAIVRYPIALGLTDAIVLRRIQNTLAIKNVFDSTLEEYRQDSWLTDFDYKVNYNKNYLLSRLSRVEWALIPTPKRSTF
jgi:hypothetical protein